MTNHLETEISIVGSLIRVQEKITACKLAIRTARAEIKANEVLIEEYEKQKAGWNAALECSIKKTDSREALHKGKRGEK